MGMTMFENVMQTERTWIDPMNPALDDLELSVRTSTILKNEGLIYLGDVALYDEDRLLRLPNFGQKSLNEIKEHLAAYQKRLGTPKPKRYYPNPSGLIPLDLVALVLPDAVERTTAGGIIIPDAVADKDAYHTQKATLVAVGGSCFAEWIEKPVPGDRVLIVQYAGTKIKGEDGLDYRIVRNEDIIALLEVDR